MFLTNYGLIFLETLAFCPTILLFPIRLTPHSRVAHYRCLGIPSLPNEILKKFQNGTFE